MTSRNALTLAVPAPPQQFALVLDEADPDYDEFVRRCRPTDPVLWWGAAFEAEAVLFRLGADGTVDTARHRDVHAALDRWNRLYPLKLEWL